MNSSISCSIIIVTYNSAATIGPCLASVLATLRPVDTVVVVDNNSRDKTVDIVRALASTYSQNNLELIVNQSNMGFSIATNQGAKACTSTYIVLLNPDTIVPPFWLKQLSDHFINPEIAAVGPVSNYACGRQSVICHWRGALPDGLNPEEAARLLYEWNCGQAEDTLLLIGFCLMLRREVMERLGYLDERLFLGNDDLELSWRLRLHGYRLRIATDVFIYHEGQHSFHTEPEKLTGQLVQESTDALYRILEAHYFPGRVPPPEELWGIAWFNPSNGNFNYGVKFHQSILIPKAYKKPAQSKHPFVSIIILTYNQQRFTEECLYAIEKNTPEPHEVIVVDNASTDDTVPWLESLAAVNQTYRLILNQENRGFAAGCNQGLALARGDYLVLLNNDVVVTREWLTGLLECLQAESHVGIVGPFTNNASGIQALGAAPYGNYQELEDYAHTFRLCNRFRRIVSRRLVGFCMLFSRQLYEEIGGLDEQFGTGNYEDDDFCLRTSIAGYRNLVAGDVYLHHHGSVSFKAAGINYQNSISRNGKLFREKWSRPVESATLAKRIAACRAREDAESLLLKEFTNDAINLLTSACREHSDDWHLQQLLGHALITAGRYEEALSICSTDSAIGLTLVAHIRMRQGRNAEAEQYLAAAINADSGIGEAYLLRGFLARQRGELEFAASLTIKGFQLAPTLPWQADMFVWLLDSEWADQLLVEVEQALELYPKSRVLARFLVQCTDALGHNEKTLKAAEHFIQFFRSDDQVLEKGLKARSVIGKWQASQMSAQTVSLCMIVKDEEQNVARCIASCRPLVDEIIVIDTGSSDHTVAIARIMGAQVHHHIWQDDFSAARNVSLAAASGEWVLVMDADEVLSEHDYVAFRQLLKVYCGKKVAFTMETRNYTNNSSLETWRANDGLYQEEAGSGWTPSSKLRLWVNMPQVRFANTIHELVEGSAQANGLEFLPCSIPIHHYGGLDTTRSEVKEKLYYRLGLKKLEQSGDNDTRALYELAVQAAGMERFDEAENLLKKVLEKESGNFLAWFNLGYALLRTGRFEESITASQHAIYLKPDLHEAVINYAIAELCAGDPVRALSTVENLLKDHPHLVIGQLVLAAIALSGAQSGRCREIFAALYLQHVDFTDFINKLAGTIFKAGKPAFAKQLLGILTSDGYGNRESLELLKTLSMYLQGQ